ncbi:MAG: gamma carbonic anhydrase family protein [Promethearchaeota archaeon]
MIGKSPVNGKSPQIHPTAFIAADAVIIGDVQIKKNANIWFGAKMRGDWGTIIIGENSSVQENCVIHVNVDSSVTVGDNVIVGHMAMIHGPAEIGTSSVVGLKATVLQGSKMGKGSFLAGGSVLKGEQSDFTLYAGVPAVKKKKYGSERIEMGLRGAQQYAQNGQRFKKAGFGMDIPEEFLAKE